MRKILLVLLAFAVMIIVGCSTTDSASKESNSDNPFSKKEKELSASVAATVNDVEIPLSDFERRLHKKLFVMKANGQVVAGKTKQEQQKNLQDAVLQELIKEKLLLSIGKENNILPTDQELQELLNQIKGNFPSEEAFKQTMASRGLNEENIINYNRVQVIKERLAAKLGGLEQANQYIIDQEKNVQVKVNQALITPIIQQEL